MVFDTDMGLPRKLKLYYYYMSILHSLRGTLEAGVNVITGFFLVIFSLPGDELIVDMLDERVAW